jgi:hypothetical protein
VRRDWPIYQVLCKCSAVHLGVAVHSGPLGFLLFSCLCSWDDCKQATSGASQELVCATIECTCGSKQHYLAPCDVSMQCCLPRDHVYTAWPDSKPSLVKGAGVATSTCFRAPRPLGFMVCSCPAHTFSRHYLCNTIRFPVPILHIAIEGRMLHVCSSSTWPC